MSDQKKKIIPKFKKKLQGFLSDESGKITKEDVLKMGMVAMGVAIFSANTPDASAHTNTHGNANTINYCYLAGTSAGTVGTIQSNAWVKTINGHTNSAIGAIGIQGSAGHSNSQYAAANHTNHNNHNNHGSHCNCGRWG